MTDFTPTDYHGLPPSPADVQKLKDDWVCDPCWDLEKSAGYEDYSEELAAFAAQKRAEWAKRDADQRRRKAPFVMDKDGRSAIRISAVTFLGRGKNNLRMTEGGTSIEDAGDVIVEGDDARYYWELLTGTSWDEEAQS